MADTAVPVCINEEEYICLFCGAVRTSEATLSVHHKLVHEDYDWLSCTVYTKPVPVVTRRALLHEERTAAYEAEMLKQQMDAIDTEEAIQAAIRANYEEFSRRT